MRAIRPPRPTLILALVCLPVFIGALDLTVISAVLPQVMYDLEIPLQSGLDDASWLVTGYLLAYTVTMSFMGRVSDLYGRRRVYLLCLALFAAGSAGVALAETLPWLIVGRVVQAIGGGAMVPVSMALVGDLFPPARRAGGGRLRRSARSRLRRPRPGERPAALSRRQGQPHRTADPAARAVAQLRRRVPLGRMQRRPRRRARNHGPARGANHGHRHRPSHRRVGASRVDDLRAFVRGPAAGRAAVGGAFAG